MPTIHRKPGLIRLLQQTNARALTLWDVCEDTDIREQVERLIQLTEAALTRARKRRGNTPETCPFTLSLYQSLTE